MVLHSKKATRRHVMALGAAALAAPAIRSAQAQTKTLVIGGSVPLTGAAAETGLNVNNGYITAVTYINDVLGGVEIAGDKYKIELKLFDDASDPARATTLIQRQIDEGTNFFLGSFGSNIVLPTAAITERAKKPMVQTGGGSDAIFTKGYKYVFGMFPRATRQFASTAAHVQVAAAPAADLFGDLDQRRLLQDRGRGRAALVRRGGLQAARGLSSCRPSRPTCRACWARCAPQRRTCWSASCTTRIRSWSRARWWPRNTNVKLLFQGLGPQLASFREALGKYSELSLCSTYWDENVPYKDKFFGDSKKFVEYYKTKFTRPIAYHVAGAAACIETYILAMQAAKSTKPEAVRDALADGRLRDLLQPHQVHARGRRRRAAAWAA